MGGYTLLTKYDVCPTLLARYHKDGADALVKGSDSTVLPRLLTPRECARLMGFDKTHEAVWRIPVSDRQAYRQFGNAVVVPVVRAIAEAMRPYILKAVE